MHGADAHCHRDNTLLETNRMERHVSEPTVILLLSALRDAIEKEEKLAKKLSAQPLGGINPATGLPLGLQQAPYGKWRNNIKLREDVQVRNPVP